MVQDRVSEGVHVDYVNERVQETLRQLQSHPDYERLAVFLESLREGYLVVDVTGSVSKKRGARVRTIRSTRGQLVLPVFTSMSQLRALQPTDRGKSMRGAVLPAREALSLILTDRFVAVEFDKASAAFVVLREYILLVVGEEVITPSLLEGMC